MKRISTAQQSLDTIERGMYGAKNIKDSLALLYHQNTKLTKFDQIKLSHSIRGFFSPYVTQRATQPYKVYPASKSISLADYRDVPAPAVDFIDLVKGRQSVRNYEPGYQLSLYELYVLLNYSYGISRQEKGEGGQMSFRYIPSPGGLYPLEIYVVLFDSHVTPGLYHFRPDTLALECLKEGDFRAELKQLIQAEPYININTASGLVLTTGIFERVMIKYGERGYRFMLHESGFVAQMMTLLNEALGLGSCMVGGYDDQKVNRFLGLNGVFETVQNVMILGKKPLAPACHANH
ncbi:SagB-type dehydrogenase domain-containing protein [Hymenobacter daecheongensis DSM 21074]|uniref:SagB-type dehydrogenase domain-containing protein n=1 Tax=Hymenobacter daecheongensis DSM 21074 TaxID=1121955 RepID=A0A1M6IX87_9BACT|nr:SagB/ThcOx family dehydrogenase [Hymenobacter daecheongensis]SHJ39076.1 SagB-type dehydrogenase domain-containing protein [Hymenobacter daecheongensis DSM 21074]